jgi:S1-C subfamily serine protease
MIKWFESNATKIILTLVIMLGLFLNIVYMQDLKRDIVILNNKVDSKLSFIQNNQEKLVDAIFKGFMVIAESLDSISQSVSYLIDQNRIKQENTQIIQSLVKPTYKELKSHTVFIIGCSNKTLDNNKLTYPINDDGVCWAGTGTVVKITDNETYILTNNHVAGANQDNVTLYVENGNKRIEAEVIQYHSYVDLSVIKVNVKLKDKTPITKISLGKVTEPVYIVGHPLGNKYIYTEGLVAGFVDISLFIQAPCIFGNSGSGVFNSNGELIGLVYALQNYPGFLGIIPMAQITHALCVDAISIKAFLEELGLYNE